MIATDIENLKYPIGKFSAPSEYTKSMFEEWIQTLEDFPKELRSEIKYLTDDQLDTPYREGGWTVRQVVHHLADSHMNSYIRFKLAVTEELPVIKPYMEERWAELEDAKHAPVELSLSLLEALHHRWVLFLRTLKEDEMKKKFHHPAMQKDIDLRFALALYTWHCKHHLAHVSSLADRNSWKQKNKF